MRRLPGWPHEELVDLLVKFRTPYFNPVCANESTLSRKLSDDEVALSFYGATCGLCHIRVSDPWFSQMKSKIHPIETSTLEKNQRDVFYNSRLACGIRLKPWMNEMIISQIRHENLDEDLSHLKNVPGMASLNKRA